MLNRLTAIAVSALLMVAAACDIPECPHELNRPLKAHVLASSLRSAYLDNPVNFTLQYRGETVSAYGKVRLIRPDGKVEFREGAFLFGDLICTFQDQDEVAKLKPKREITVAGTVQSVDGWYVHLTDCELVMTDVNNECRCGCGDD